MPELMLSLDLGTTSVRAIVVDPTGRILAQASSPLEVSFPQPGWVEQDPNQLWDRSVGVLTEAMNRFSSSDIAGLGLVTQRATAIAFDAKTGSALAPAIGWQDVRTQARVAELADMGLPIPAQASATKFEWLLGKAEGLEAAGDLRLVTPDAWLTYKLTGSCVTDPSNASATALYDITTGEWSTDLAALFSVDLDTMADVVGTAEVIGTTAVLGGDIPVAARAGDQQAACFGQGIINPGQSKLTLGTSAMLDRNTGAELTLLDGTVPLALWQMPGQPLTLCVEATVLTAGATVEWLVSLGLLPSPVDLDAVASSVDGTDGVAVVPALQGLGSPYSDGDARGFIGGLTRGSTGAHIVRATVDGLAHRCADLCDAVQLSPGTPLPVDGGLAQSATLVQLIADYSGRPVEVAAQIETTALGGALLAGIATGVYDDQHAAASVIGLPTTIDPRISDTERAHARDRWSWVVERSRS